MAIGVVTDSDFDKELARAQGEKSNGEVKDLTRGRPKGSENVPTEVQKIIGETAIKEGNGEAEDLAEELGISKQSVHAYKKGATSLATYDEPKPELANHINDVKRLISNEAKNTLLSALQSITHDKLQDTKPRDAAGIARDMSAVIKNIEPEQKDGPPVQFVLLAPPMKEEKEYEVIDVKE